MTRTLTLVPALLALATGCWQMATPRDVAGNFDVTFLEVQRIYVNDELVAEVTAGDDATFTFDGETFQVGAVCSDEGVQCPAEVFWNVVAFDQPWGPDSHLLNLVNLDPTIGEGGERLGGRLLEDGTFDLLSGLGLDTLGACRALAVGTVHGAFDEANEAIAGVVRYEYGAGCTIGGATLRGKLAVETDYTAARTGDLDLSSVEAAPPVTEDGEPAEASSTPE
jgi:hypothetical protein